MQAEDGIIAFGSRPSVEQAYQVNGETEIDQHARDRPAFPLIAMTTKPFVDLGEQHAASAVVEQESPPLQSIERCQANGLADPFDAQGAYPGHLETGGRIVRDDVDRRGVGRATTDARWVGLEIDVERRCSLLEPTDRNQGKPLAEFSGWHR